MTLESNRGTKPTRGPSGDDSGNVPTIDLTSDEIITIIESSDDEVEVINTVRKDGKEGKKKVVAKVNNDDNINEMDWTEGDGSKDVAIHRVMMNLVSSPSSKERKHHLKPRANMECYPELRMSPIAIPKKVDKEYSRAILNTTTLEENSNETQHEHMKEGEVASNVTSNDISAVRGRNNTPNSNEYGSVLNNNETYTKQQQANYNQAAKNNNSSVDNTNNNENITAGSCNTTQNDKAQTMFDKEYVNCMPARFNTLCPKCGRQIKVGDPITNLINKVNGGGWGHVNCDYPHGPPIPSSPTRAQTTMPHQFHTPEQSQHKIDRGRLTDDQRQRMERNRQDALAKRKKSNQSLKTKKANPYNASANFNFNSEEDEADHWIRNFNLNGSENITPMTRPKRIAQTTNKSDEQVRGEKNSNIESSRRPAGYKDYANIKEIKINMQKEMEVQQHETVHSERNNGVNRQQQQAVKSKRSNEKERQPQQTDEMERGNEKERQPQQTDEMERGNEKEQQPQQTDETERGNDEQQQPQKEEESKRGNDEQQQQQKADESERGNEEEKQPQQADASTKSNEVNKQQSQQAQDADMDEATTNGELKGEVKKRNRVSGFQEKQNIKHRNVMEAISLLSRMQDNTSEEYKQAFMRITPGNKEAPTEEDTTTNTNDKDEENKETQNAYRNDQNSKQTESNDNKGNEVQNNTTKTGNKEGEKVMNVGSNTNNKKYDDTPFLHQTTTNTTALARENDIQMMDRDDNERCNENNSDNKSEGSHDNTTTEDELENNSFVTGASDNNNEDDEWSNSNDESESTGNENDEYEGGDYYNDESDLEIINGNESNEGEWGGGNYNEQQSTRRLRRSTTRPTTYRESNENSEYDEDDMNEEGSSDNNSDSDQSSGIIDDYDDDEHEDDVYGSDENDGDASIRSENEDEMSDNDYIEPLGRARIQKTIGDCRPFYVRKQ